MRGERRERGESEGEEEQGQKKERGRGNHTMKVNMQGGGSQEAQEKLLLAEKGRWKAEGPRASPGRQPFQGLLCCREFICFHVPGFPFPITLASTHLHPGSLGAHRTGSYGS
jgi:hypothetical protein